MKCKKKFISGLLLGSLVLLSIIPLLPSETTFFDQNNIFIMYQYKNNENSIITSGGGGSSSTCHYQWDCSEWSLCTTTGKQNRGCGNTGDCTDNYKPPITEKPCVYTYQQLTEKKIVSNQTEKNESIPHNLIEEKKELLSKISTKKENKWKKIIIYLGIMVFALLMIVSLISCFKSKKFKP